MEHLTTYFIVVLVFVKISATSVTNKLTACLWGNRLKPKKCRFSFVLTLFPLTKEQICKFFLLEIN